MATDMDMYEMSPFYAELVDSYGDTMPPSAAQIVARAHKTDLESLAFDEGLEITRECIDTREFVGALGY